MHHLQNVPLQNHLLTIQSEVGHATDFLARVPKTLKLPRGFYNVGLLEMRCFQVGSTLSDEDSGVDGQQTKPEDVPTVNEPPPPLFPGIQPPTTTPHQFVYNKVDMLMTLQINFNSAMTKSNVPVQLGVFYVSATEALVRISITHKDVNKYVVISKPFALALGFRRRCFYLGKYWGESIITNDNLSLLVDKGIYTVDIVEFPYRDSRIGLDRKYTELLPVTKAASIAMKTFLPDMVTSINANGYNLSLTITQWNKVQLQFNSVNRSDEFIRLPDDLAQLLGFNVQKTFPVGTYEADTAINDKTFNVLTQRKYVIEMGRYHTLPIFMKEPSSDSYVDVVSEINESFPTATYDELLPQFQVKDGKMFVTNISDDVILKLPVAVNRYFGLQEDAEFTSSTVYTVREEIIEQERVLEEKQTEGEVVTDTTKPSGIAENVLILVDLIENQGFLNRLVPVLQQTVWDLKGDHVAEKRPVVYLPLCCEDVTFVRVTLVDEFLQQINLPANYITRLQLHFKSTI